MSKLMIALIAGALAAGAGAQTGTVTTATVGEHGTPAMHAAETAKNVQVSKTHKGLSGNKERQQALSDAQKVAEHGTPAGHAQEASLNVAAPKGQAKPLADSKASQEAVRKAAKGIRK
jgi:hypothetical protein